MLTPLNRKSKFANEFIDIAMFHAALWHDAYKTQLTRVLADEEPSEQRMVEFIFLVIALHNFRLALYRCRDELENAVGRGSGVRERRKAARWALEAAERFDRRLPQVTQIRNVFSHFEEYAFGAGRLQRVSGEPISVLSDGTRTFIIRDSDNHFELDLDATAAAVNSVMECWIEVLVYAE